MDSLLPFTPSSAQLRNSCLFFLGTIAISHVPRGLTAHEDVGIERAVDMTSGKSFDSNAV
ncbi:hypothetical protein H6F53_22330 [Trichocoleus sp. FACHB-832]|uniref:hypothetical protein n=1 Tax=Trichocoleus sp. FACHB-832 TaxID=2692875 RepID=UPI00168475F8|nr:hypothetical protein [Trichocoleus sp. FACHB-832]MBD1908188.1 hypothetical protein [Trichocoleus sp. FACHB-832]